MSFLESIFGTSATEEEAASIKKERDQLRKTNEELQYELRMSRRANERLVVDTENEKERLREHLNADVNLRERMLDSRESYLDEEVSLKAQSIEAKVRSQFQDRIDTLRDSVQTLDSARATAESQAKERLVVIESLQNQLADYRSFVEFAMTKLPNVDLSKFNINVDVPPAEVHVTGNQQGAKKKS